MDHKQTMGVNSRVLDQKQLNIFGRISLFWSVELQGHPEQLNGGDHDWLTETGNSSILAAIISAFKQVLVQLSVTAVTRFKIRGLLYSRSRR